MSTQGGIITGFIKNISGKYTKRLLIVFAIVGETDNHPFSV
ncbi:hypothetical protein HmCmsJML183_00468 [Escherichia coli]|nr:hypothetical protein HmCmsJML183_00468 [Escherichia coli]